MMISDGDSPATLLIVVVFRTYQDHSQRFGAEDQSDAANEPVEPVEAEQAFDRMQDQAVETTAEMQRSAKVVFEEIGNAYDR